tara:strand:- start:492 stop:890 length:399 start_codon:yes stop_codon:yes gene_type:complete
MCIQNESVVPQFSLRDNIGKGTTQSHKRGRLKKIFFQAISLCCACSVLLPKTAFEKKNRKEIFSFLILSRLLCQEVSFVCCTFCLSWLFLLCRLLSPPPRFAVVIIIIIIIKTERRQKEEKKEDDSILKAYV